MTEQELASLAQRGDQDAFAQLVRDNERQVYTLALRLCGNPEDAMDLAQEAPDVPDHTGDPHQALERKERRQALERGLAQLPEHYRSVLVLRELSGLSYQEIGDVLKLDLGTVRSRLARARGELRKILRKDGNFFDSGASNPVNKKGGAP